MHTVYLLQGRSAFLLTWLVDERHAYVFVLHYQYHDALSLPKKCKIYLLFLESLIALQNHFPQLLLLKLLAIVLILRVYCLLSIRQDYPLCLHKYEKEKNLLCDAAMSNYLYLLQTSQSSWAEYLLNECLNKSFL